MSIENEHAKTVKKSCLYCNKLDPVYLGSYCNIFCYDVQIKKEKFEKRASRLCANCNTQNNIISYWTTVTVGCANKASGDRYFCSRECLDNFEQTKKCRDCGRGKEDNLVQIGEGDDAFVLCQFWADDHTCYKKFLQEKAIKKFGAKLCTECHINYCDVEYNIRLTYKTRNVKVYFCSKNCLTDFTSRFGESKDSDASNND